MLHAHRPRYVIPIPAGVVDDHVPLQWHANVKSDIGIGIGIVIATSTAISTAIGIGKPNPIQSNPMDASNGIGFTHLATLVLFP